MNPYFRPILCSWLWLGLASAWAAPGPIYVNHKATGANNGSKWGDAYTSLAAGLAAADASATDKEVWVATGIYYPGNSVSDGFLVGGGVQLYGGFSGTESDRQQADPAALPTILSGDIGMDDNTTDGITYNAADQKGQNCHQVVRADLSATGTVMDGMIITAGAATDATVWRGGGLQIGDSSFPPQPIALNRCWFFGNSASRAGAVYVLRGAPSFTDCHFEGNQATGSDGGAVAEDSFSLLTFEDCYFRNNDAERSGGGIHFQLSDGLLRDCQFRDNESNNGGAIAAAPGEVHATKCTFRGNHARLRGGAAWASGYTEFTSCLFIGNSSGIDGGALQFYHNDAGPIDAMVVNCLISGNWAAEEGGGAHVSETGETPALVHFENSTLTGNAALLAGGAVANGASDLVFENSILWNNSAAGATNTPSATIEFYENVATNSEIGTAEFDHCLVDNGFSSGAWTGALGIDKGGNFAVDPKFLNPIPPTSAPTVSGSYHLATTSPALDAGEATLMPADSADLDSDGNTAERLPRDLAGSTRVPNANVDVGAYERSGSFPDAISDGYTIGEDQVATFNVLANDPVPPAMQAEVVILVEPQHGSVEPSPSGTAFIYTPDPDFFGTDAFKYFYRDSNGGLGSEAAAVDIQVNSGANDPPSFTPSLVRLNGASGSTVSISDWATDIMTDAGGYETGQNLSFITNVINSDFGFNSLPKAFPDGSLTFAPAAGASGVALVEATLSDDGPGTPSTTVAFAIVIDTNVRLFVNAAAPNPGFGLSWASPFAHLTEALDHAIDGDEIWVAQGVYKPGADPSDSFEIRSRALVYGGFKGNENSLGKRNPDTNPTVLTGDLDGDDTLGSGAITASPRGSNARNVVTATGYSGLARLDGFIITGGNANGSDSEARGGGAYIDSAGLDMRNCHFSGNRALSGGGGVYVSDSTTTRVEDSKFDNNLCYNRGGGAIALFDGANVVIEGSSFVDNFANAISGSGSGIFVNGAAVQITGSSFTSNQGTAVEIRFSTANCNIDRTVFDDNSGGGLRVILSSTASVDRCSFIRTSGAGADIATMSVATFTNCLFANNFAGSGGAGICAFNEADVTVKNCTFAGNRTSFGPVGINSEFNSVVRAENSIFYNNAWGSNPNHPASGIGTTSGSASARHCLIQGSNSGGAWVAHCTDLGNNIDADPLFYSTPDESLGILGNARLQPGSPAYGAGSNALNSTTADLNGLTRVQGSTIDMGAYESLPTNFSDLHPGLNPNTDANGNGYTNFFDYAAGYSPTGQGAPNPLSTMSGSPGDNSFTYIRRDGVTDADGVLQICVDLGTWIDLVEGSDYNTTSSSLPGARSQIHASLLPNAYLKADPGNGVGTTRVFLRWRHP